MAANLPKCLAALFLSSSLLACTPVDPYTGSASTTAVTPGTYVVDPSSGFTGASHDEWTFASTGALSISRLTWDGATQSGCVSLKIPGNTWSTASGDLVVTYSPNASVRTSCDSAFHDTTLSRSGSVAYPLRDDSLGFDYYDASAARWHVMKRL